MDNSIPESGEAHTCHICLKQFSRRDLRERHRRRCEKSIGKIIPTKKRSCERCISFKVKCDYAKPSCGRCVSRSVQCEYRLEPKIKMPANPAYKPPAPRARVSGVKARAASKPETPPRVPAMSTMPAMRATPAYMARHLSEMPTPDLTPDMMIDYSRDMSADFGSDTTWTESGGSPLDAWSDATSSLAGEPLFVDDCNPELTWAISMDALDPALCMDAGDMVPALSFYADPQALSGTLQEAKPVFNEVFW